MSELLAEIPGVCCFLDDIVICSQSRAEQYDRVGSVLKVLQEANIQLNLKKCQFDLPKIDFLGYVVSGNGISPSPEKIEAILQAPIPTNLAELQSFIGMVTYYNRFVHKFSEIMSPLYDLTKKNVKFKWTKLMHSSSALSLQDTEADLPILLECP